MKKAALLLFLSSTAFAEDYKLVGKALLEYSVFNIDIYEISYFKAPNKDEKIVLDYKTNVAKKYSLVGWKKGLAPVLKENPAYKANAEWIYKNTVDLSKGDLLTIEKNDKKTSLKKNGEVMATTDDPIVYKLIFEPWIGKKPIDKKLKNKLLSK